MAIEEIIIDKLLKDSPLYQFTKDSKIGRGWEEIKGISWLCIIIAAMLMALPIVFTIIEKIIL